MSDSSSSVLNSHANHLHSRDSIMQKKTPENLAIPFGRASQMVKRNSSVPQQSSPVRLEEEEEYENECCATQSNCMLDCSEKQENIGTNTTGLKRKNVRMVWMNDCHLRNFSITQLPHPSQLRKRRKQCYGKTKPLGWDFMSHVQQLHRKKEEFESMKNDNTDLGNFLPERNLMYVHVVRSQTEAPPDAEENAVPDAQETQEQNITALVGSSPPKMRERSFNLFPFYEE